VGIPQLRTGPSDGDNLTVEGLIQVGGRRLFFAFLREPVMLNIGIGRGEQAKTLPRCDRDRHVLLQLLMESAYGPSRVRCLCGFNPGGRLIVFALRRRTMFANELNLVAWKILSAFAQIRWAGPSGGHATSAGFQPASLSAAPANSSPRGIGRRIVCLDRSSFGSLCSGNLDQRQLSKSLALRQESAT
jgi:hypothetical protein